MYAPALGLALSARAPLERWNKNARNNASAHRCTTRPSAYAGAYAQEGRVDEAKACADEAPLMSVDDALPTTCAVPKPAGPQPDTATRKTRAEERNGASAGTPSADEGMSAGLPYPEKEDPGPRPNIALHRRESRAGGELQRLSSGGWGGYPAEGRNAQRTGRAVAHGR